MSTPKQMLGTLFGLLMLFVSATASADSGWVSGKWEFWNKNGNYCPTGRNCTGANYVQSQYDARQPLRNIQVFIQHDTAGIIGSGSTDTAGNYNISWSYTGTLPSKDKTRVWVRPWHDDGRFKINNAAGQYPNNWTPYFTIQAGTTQGSPQSRGTWCVGACTSASPDPYYNVFWAAEMAWRLRLGTAGWFDVFLTNTEVRGFANSIPGFKGTCNTSCASNNTIQLDANAGYKPQARMIHEYGHIAIENSNDWSFSNECYLKNDSAGWSTTSNEWACSGFEEGYATFLSDSTMYTHNAVAPHTCNSSGACSTNSFNVEASTGSANCATAEGSQPLSVMRYLWDVFDNVNDGESTSEGAAGQWWRMYRVYQHYTVGTGTNQTDEHWNSSYTALDAKDGRGSNSYRTNYSNIYSLSTTTARTLNCSPP